MNKTPLEYICENSNLLDKYPRLEPTLNSRTGHYYLRYCIQNKDTFINEFAGLNLPKAMVLYNIKKYGFDKDKAYIMESLFE